MSQPLCTVEDMENLIQWWWGPLEAIVDFGGWIVVLGALALWGWVFPAENTPATKNIRDLTKEENAEWKKNRDRLRDIERGRFFGRR